MSERNGQGGGGQEKINDVTNWSENNGDGKIFLPTLVAISAQLVLDELSHGQKRSGAGKSSTGRIGRSLVCPDVFESVGQAGVHRQLVGYPGGLQEEAARGQSFA